VEFSILIDNLITILTPLNIFLSILSNNAPLDLALSIFNKFSLSLSLCRRDETEQLQNNLCHVGVTLRFYVFNKRFRSSKYDDGWKNKQREPTTCIFAHEKTAKLHSNGFSVCEFFMRYLNITLYATFIPKRFELFHSKRSSMTFS